MIDQDISTDIRQPKQEIKKKENFARTWRRAAVPFTMERVPDAFFVAFKARRREGRHERNRGEELESSTCNPLFGVS